MGKGSNLAEESQKKSHNETFYSWDEIKSNKYWIVINGKVYNVQNFITKHPGGDQIIMNHATQDATVSIKNIMNFNFLLNNEKIKRTHLWPFTMI